MKKFILISILFFTLYNTSNATLTTPGIVSPFNGATNQNPNVQIDWSSVTGATNYEFKLGTNPTLSGVPAQSSGSNSYYNTSELLFGTTYYWQVRAKSATDSSNWSAIWHFTTIDQQTAPNLISPPNNSINIPITGTTLEWSQVPYAIFYEYEYDTNSSFTNPIINTTTSLLATTGALQFNTTYYWKVRAAFADYTYSQWSDVWSFTTEIQSTVNEIQNEDISIFPNPAGDNLSILIHDNSISLVNISLIDINGKIIWMQNDVYQKIIYLDVKSFSNGQYFLKIENFNKKIIIPIIIEH